MKLIKFQENISIDENVINVFDYTQDYNKRLQWDSFLKKADLLNDAKIADKGVKAKCIAKNGIAMTTEYITFNRPKVTAVKMPNQSYIFKSFVGSWRFQEISKQKTEVIFIYSFSLKFPFNLFKKFIKNNLQLNVRQRLTDLKINIENEIHKRTYSINSSERN